MKREEKSFVEHSPTSSSWVGPEATNVVRMISLLHGLKLETEGLRLTAKAPTCYSIIKREYGLRGSKQKVLEQFEPMVREARSKLKEYTVE